jgi:hypothetical protein
VGFGNFTLATHGSYLWPWGQQAYKPGVALNASESRGNKQSSELCIATKELRDLVILLAGSKAYIYLIQHITSLGGEGGYENFVNQSLNSRSLVLTVNKHTSGC